VKCYTDTKGASNELVTGTRAVYSEVEDVILSDFLSVWCVWGICVAGRLNCSILRLAQCREIAMINKGRDSASPRRDRLYTAHPETIASRTLEVHPSITPIL
jgi:hypothetical protein